MGKTSAKPIALVKGHRTKAERAIREKEESRLLTGISFEPDSEVKKDPIAYKEFMRLKKLFKKINKDEGLQENVMNRYCKLHSECFKYEKMIENKSQQITELRNHFESGEIEYIKYIDKETYITNQLLGLDKKLMDKRKMMLDIEKENIMTIASVMRAIPKKPDEEKEINPFDNIVRMQK